MDIYLITSLVSLALLGGLFLVLLRESRVKAIYALLFSSLLLYKPLFSIFIWDLLPVRVFMAVVSVFAVVHFVAHRPKLGRLLMLLGALLLVRALSLVNSLNLPASLAMLAFFTAIVGFAYWFYFEYNDKPAQILHFIKVYLGMATLFSLVALLQLAVYYAFGYEFGTIWTYSARAPRVGAFFWDANHFAAFLGSLLLVNAAFLFAAKTPGEKMLYGFSLLLNLLAFWFAGSKSAFLAFFTAVTLFFVILAWQHYKVAFLKASSALAGVAVVLIALYSAQLSFLAEKAVSSASLSVKAHFQLLIGSYQVAQKYPMLGGGYGSFFDHFIDTPVAPAFFNTDLAAILSKVNPHSVWGEVVGETGLLGLLAFIALFAYILSSIFVSYQNAYAANLKAQASLLLAMFCSIFGLLVGGIFYSYNSEFFWFIVLFYFIYAQGTNLKDLLK